MDRLYNTYTNYSLNVNFCRENILWILVKYVSSLWSILTILLQWLWKLEECIGSVVSAWVDRKHCIEYSGITSESRKTATQAFLIPPKSIVIIWLHKCNALTKSLYQRTYYIHSNRTLQRATIFHLFRFAYGIDKRFPIGNCQLCVPSHIV